MATSNVFYLQFGGCCSLIAAIRVYILSCTYAVEVVFTILELDAELEIGVGE